MFTRKLWITALIWVLANMAGFLLGSLLGATDGGLIPALFGGTGDRVGLILGDLAFGASIGLAQWLAMRATYWRGLSPLWIALTAIGFMIGARIGPAVTFRVATVPAMLPIVFGIVMGTAQGIATWWLVRRRYLRPQLWIAVVALAWIVGEAIAFNLDFSHWGVPLVGAAVAAVTGLYLLVLNRPSSLADSALPLT